MKSSIGYENYLEIATQYALLSENRPLNKYLERPAMRSLLPDLKGKTVVDAGCGSGVMSAWLISQQAKLIAFDVSPIMVQATKDRLSSITVDSVNNVSINIANLDEPLEFIESDSVDIVLCSLVLDYILDWSIVFKEINRILVPKGYLIFSCTHPIELYRHSETGNYFSKELLELPWKLFGEPYPIIKVYRRSLDDIWSSLISSSLVPDVLVEPRPISEYSDIDPDDFNRLNSKPKLLCVRARTNKIDQGQINDSD